MDLVQFLTLLRVRKGLFWSIFLLVVAIAIALALILPKTYLGEVSVIVDSKLSDPITGQISPELLQAASLATQVDVISSHNVAAKVVDKLNLTSIPELQDEFRDETEGRGNVRDWIADKLLRRLEVKPSRTSNMVKIRFGSSDPNSAALIANAFGDAYIQTSLELKSDPARRQAIWFDSQLKDMRTVLETAQRRLSEFQRSEGMVNTSDDRLDVESAKLGELTTQLVGAQTAMYDARTKLKQMNDALAKKRLAELPDILGNPVLQSLKVDLVRAQGALAQTQQRFGRNHPQYVSESAQVASLQSRFDAEVEIARGAITQTAQIAERRTAELQTAVEQQKKHILGLKAHHDQLDVLTKDVDNAQRAYDAAALRASEVHLQGHLDQSNIAILNHAVAPLQPARPNLLLYLAVGIVLGGTFSTATVLALELRNPRVRTRQDIVRAAGLVVLAEVPRLEGRLGRHWSRRRLTSNGPKYDSRRLSGARS